MQWLLVSAAVLTSLGVSDTAPSRDHPDSPRMLSQHQQHLHDIAAFPCLAPQSRLLRPQDLLPAHQTLGKAYVPERTVLRHCDASCGSCPLGQACGPLHVDFVKRAFQVTFLQDSRSHREDSWSWEVLDLANHTLCTCYDEQVLSSRTDLFLQTAA